MDDLDGLTRLIHFHWRARRQAFGWRLGPPNHRWKTTPYLKPLGEFTQAELTRERLLAEADLNAIARSLGNMRFASRRAAARRLCSAMRHRGFMASVCHHAHQDWRAVNLALGLDDARLRLPFHALPPHLAAITLDNVRADITALRHYLDRAD
ncbi:MAG: hypothetical protein NW215_10290 [Hyphomicrobiales bacterium]|nr:hypothetical protein [Hyphomicrobiales bacterium]